MGRIAVTGFFLLLVAAAPSQPPADAVARLKTAIPSLDVLHTLQPCFLHGDFDGDGSADIALQVRDHATGKVGIAIEHTSSHEWLVVAAGHRLSSAEDDFDWMDSWRVQRNTVTRKGDAILAEKSGRASGLVFWTGREYRWFQQSE